jgi:uncharacterized membrane protein YqiK
VQQLEVERRKTLELAEQQRAIAMPRRRRPNPMPRLAETARAKAVAAGEGVLRARDRGGRASQADRDHRGTAGRRARRHPHPPASRGREVRRRRPRRARRLDAEGEAEAEKIRALAAKLRYEIEAEGSRQMNEAQNILSPESRASNARLRLIDKIEGIIRESVKPLEKIEGIRILQVDGLGGSAPAAAGDEGRGNFSDSIVNSALRYRAQAPLVDTLLKEIGLSGGDVSKLADALSQPISKARRDEPPG